MALFALLLAPLGCGREFEPYWRVNTLRVLAIQSDPVTLKQGETAELSAIVFAPPGEEVRYEWSWCPVRTTAQNRYECPITRENLGEWLSGAAPGAQGSAPGDVGADAGDAGDEPPAIPQALANIEFDLGNEPTARLTNQFPAPLLLASCEAVVARIASLPANSPLADLLPTVDCTRGFDVSVRLVVRSGSQEVISSKRMTLWTGSEQINRNPRVQSLQIRPESLDKARRHLDRMPWLPAVDATGEDLWHTISAGAPTPVVPEVPMKVRVLADPESVETWQPPAPKGSDREFLDPEPEVFTYRWFATLGEIEDSRRIYSEEFNTLESASETSLTLSAEDRRKCRAQQDPEACTVRLWAVVRDGRLGLAWGDGALKLVDP